MGIQVLAPDLSFTKYNDGWRSTTSGFNGGQAVERDAVNPHSQI